MSALSSADVDTSRGSKGGAVLVTRLRDSRLAPLVTGSKPASPSLRRPWLRPLVTALEPTPLVTLALRTWPSLRQP